MTSKTKKSTTKPKAATSTRKPSQTARILENVELLVELQKDSSDNEKQLDDLLKQIEQLTQESEQLSTKTDQLFASLQDSQESVTTAASSDTSTLDGIVESLEAKLEEQFTGIHEKIGELSKRVDSIGKSKTSKTAKKGFAPNNDLKKIESLLKSQAKSQSESAQANQESVEEQFSLLMEQFADFEQRLENNETHNLERISQLEKKLDALGSNKPNKKSQTETRLLKQVEDLNKKLDSSNKTVNAISETLAESTAATESDVLDDRLNNLEEQLLAIQSHLETASSDSSDPAISDEWLEQIESKLENVESKLENASPNTDKIITEIRSTIKADLEEQLSETAELQLEAIQNQLSTVVTGQSDDANIPTSWLEQIENSIHQSQPDTSKLAEEIQTKIKTDLEKSFSKLSELHLEVIESRVPTAEGEPADTESWLARLESVAAEAQSNKTEIIETIQLSLTTDLNERFCSVDEQISKITEAIEGQFALIEQLQTYIASQQSYEGEAETAISGFQVQLDELFQHVTGRVTQFSEFLARQDIEAESEETPADEISHWERQKAAVLDKYGIDPEHRPDISMPTMKTDSVDEALTKQVDELEENGEADQEEIAAIEQLKEDLTTKLREAEIELSINRAKLSQQQAELEEKQVELDRREKQLQKKLEKQAPTPEKSSGMLERMKRHLPFQNNDE